MVGCGQAPSASRAVATRNSILPRRKAAASSSRSAGSRPRNSSGRRSDRSRKRPFTERASTVTSGRARAVAGGSDAARRWHTPSCYKLPSCSRPVKTSDYVEAQTSPVAIGHRGRRLHRSSRSWRPAASASSTWRKATSEQLVAIKEYLPSSLAERSPGELTPRVKPDKQPLYRLGLKSFFEEGRSLAQISHPSVVSVLNFFRENETVYMVMNYLQGDTLQDFIVTARDLKRDKVFRESTIRSLFDEILRGLRIVHQHKMLHLDIKPANIFVTNDNKAVMLDFGAAREVLSKEGNFIRPMYTPGFAAPEMYRRDGTLGPWTDIYAIGACIYACMQGYPPNDAPQRLEKDRLALSLSRLRNVYSDNLIEVTEWCMSLDPLSRPQSVFALQKELARETERRYTKLSFSERLKLQLETIKTGAKA